MEKLLTLRDYINSGKYKDTLLLIDELDEMSLDDKINKISSFSIILLLHLIKQQAEKRTTGSWDASIAESLIQIKRANKHRKSKGFYANKEKINAILEDDFLPALHLASSEAFEGKYSTKQFGKLINKNQIIEKALSLITEIKLPQRHKNSKIS